ncbi:hypothetical protein [Ancylobacter lacus]|uniref:hypothetical protein n=1 Tax=Ancylobacter lacus TaxID=2579970 RepID=UPI001BCADA2C|nr:hypothetical protein [Ancylobacter lacus]MBS7541319.1 hypothetical protein [Ancylobacter lacus]
MMLRRALLAATLALTPALALADGQTEMFVVDNSDGYGIDACVASGSSCGAAMAEAWCRVHDYSRVVSFGKVQSDAGKARLISANARTACNGGSCTDVVAITCGR